MNVAGSLDSAAMRTVVCAAVLAAGMLAIAPPAAAAPVFDEPGYSMCTATTYPSPDQTVDMVVTDCCVNHGGLPTPTNFGVGCVKQVDNPSPDYRPTIVLPQRPGDPSEQALEELDKLPPLP